MASAAQQWLCSSFGNELTELVGEAWLTKVAEVFVRDKFLLEQVCIVADFY